MAAAAAGAPAALGAVLPVQGTIDAVAAFLDEAQRICTDLQEQEEAEVAALLKERQEELSGRAAEMHAAIASLRDELGPAVANGQPLPAQALSALDAALERGEQPVASGGKSGGGKSDRIPPQLLSAEFGSKLYPGLVKKVEVILGRSLEEIERRLTDTLRERVLQGGVHQPFDEQRARRAAERDTALERCAEAHALVLAQSDHQPVVEELVLEGGSKPCRVMCWNTLEFPCIEGPKPGVLDGITPYCDELLRVLERKEARPLLLEAMKSRTAATRHLEHVVAVLRSAMQQEERSIDVVLLQEVSTELQERVAELCAEAGWSSHFAPKNEDPTKCNAITGILSRKPLDELSQAAVQENKKTRHFAAGRLGAMWFVSCHVPHEVHKQGKKDGNVDVATRVLSQLVEQFLGKAAASEAEQLVVGGDWNSDIRAVHVRFVAQKPECLRAEAEVELLAPEGSTCVGTAATIDGLLRVRR